MTPYPYPVIVLPGIMGSELRDEYPVSPQTVWSPFKLLVKAYDRITLHPDNTQLELKEPARVVRDQTFELIYSEFIQELRHNLSPQGDQPVPVFPFSYDWRQALEVAQEELARFVEEVISRTKLLRHYHDKGYGSANFPAKVNLAAHSMGGLIVAGYFKKYGSEKVYKVATIATPFRGSLEAVEKVTTGEGGLGGATSSSREREAARVTPALYYLLPTFTGAVDPKPEPGLSDDLFLPTSWQPGILETLASFIRIYGLDRSDQRPQALRLLTNLLDFVKRHRTGMEGLALNDTKRWLCIVGVNAETLVKMQIKKDEQGKPRFDLSKNGRRNDWKDPVVAKRTQTGDETVPYMGARSSFIPTEQIVCVIPGDYGFWEVKDKLLNRAGFHVNLPNMNLVQRLVVSHFKDTKYGDVWGRAAPDLPAGKVWDPPIKDLKQQN
jgi:pimeloyl-ACP methyl ester carboxylesterase